MTKSEEWLIWLAVTGIVIYGAVLIRNETGFNGVLPIAWRAAVEWVRR
jgi:hypothetical protein